MSGLPVHQEVRDAQRAEPPRGIVRDQHLVRREGAAEVQRGGGDGDGAVAQRSVMSSGDVHAHRGLPERAGVDDCCPRAYGFARRFPIAKVFDAQYGSATYVPVDGPAELELRVSTSGLLLRPASPSPG